MAVRAEATRRRLVIGGWALSVLLSMGAGWWAASVTLQPPSTEPAPSRPATYTVVEGTIERRLEFTAAASWPSSPLATNTASGTVTSVDMQPGQAVDVGDVLYAVDERPVVVAEGAVPMYRSLSVGASGRDVHQLQELLVDLGFYFGEPSGSFTAGTAEAVRRWQQDLGLPGGEVVEQGDVVFAPALPTRVMLAPEISVGRQVSAGLDAVQRLGKAPKFTVTLADGQADEVPPDAPVEVLHEDGVWSSSIASMEGTVEGETELVLAGADGGDLCGNECLDIVVPGKESRFRVQIVVVPATTGPMVPAAAITTDASGTAFVTAAADGDQVPVTLTARDSGHAIVDGIEPGVEILLFGDSS